MGIPAEDVEQYLTDLQHPLKEGVLLLRTTILATVTTYQAQIGALVARWVRS